MKVVFDVEPDDIVKFAQILLRNRLDHQIVDAKDYDEDDEDNEGFVSVQVEVPKSRKFDSIVKKLRDLSKEEDEDGDEDQDEKDNNEDE